MREGLRVVGEWSQQPMLGQPLQEVVGTATVVILQPGPDRTAAACRGNGAEAARRRVPPLHTTTISSLQWSLGPHSSTPFSARTCMESAMLLEANTKSSCPVAIAGEAPML